MAQPWNEKDPCELPEVSYVKQTKTLPEARVLTNIDDAAVLSTGIGITDYYGKFFVHDSRGYIDRIEILATNIGIADETVVMEVRQYIPKNNDCLPVFSVVITVPALTILPTWVGVDVNIMHNHDPLFLYSRECGPNVSLYYDILGNFDGYVSNDFGFNWSSQNRRYAFRVVQTGTLTGTIGVSGVVNIKDIENTVQTITGRSDTDDFRTTISNWIDPAVYAVSWESVAAGTNWRGKFFSRGMRGNLYRVQVYVRNGGIAEDIVLGFRSFISRDREGNVEEFEVTINVGGGYTGWVTGTIRRFWNYDPLFVYIKDNGVNTDIGYDILLPAVPPFLENFDGYNSNDYGFIWTPEARRYGIQLIYTGKTEEGDIPITGVVNVKNIEDTVTTLAIRTDNEERRATISNWIDPVVYPALWQGATTNFKGKFFARGMRGFVSQVRVYARNTGAGAENITLGFRSFIPYTNDTLEEFEGTISMPVGDA